ncbi:hypothetical protein [Micromonospora sp. NPDC005324]|uniref:hypothetical protein n=1 Tax=Micromonospora sp. NPDC005324 TaxID=3157033 RepID=UPI0033A5D1DB
MELLTPPAERDLPAHRAAEMRARLMAEIRTPTKSPTRRRIAVALAATIAVAAISLAVWPNHDQARQFLAFGPNELSPPLRQDAERCLTLNEREYQVPVTIADLAVAAEQGDHTALMFLKDTHYLACDNWHPPQQGWSGGAASSADDANWRPDWLPGPVQRLSLSGSTDPDGGDVVAIGRVSARVHRLVLDHGDGKITPARIAGGAFGLITDDGHVSDHGNADLVAYDNAGNEIDRRPLFTPFDQLGRCYTDTAGTVVYGKPGPTCRPAEPWTHQR